MRARLAALYLLCATSASAALPGIVYEYFEPNVVRADQPSASLKYVIGTTGEVPKFRIECFSGTKVLMTKESATRFSATIKASDALHGYQSKAAGTNANLFGFLVPLDAAGNPLKPTLQMSIRVFDSNIPNVPIADLRERVRATRRVVNIAVGTLTRVPADNITSRFYFYFGGDFYDFLSVVFSKPSFVANREHKVIRADAKGIGEDLFVNQTALYGSAGALLGVNIFPIVALFDGGADAMAHEIGHQWINHLKMKEGLFHWPPSTMARGLMGVSLAFQNEGGEFRFDLVPAGAGWKFVSAPLLHKFVDLDLYLMGLLPPEKVGINRVVFNQKQEPCNECPVTGTVETLTISQVIATHGARVPSAATSKKKFRMGTVVFSQDPLSDEEMLVLDYFAGRAESKTPVPDLYGGTGTPFFVATGGLGQLDTSLVWPPKFPLITGIAPAVLPKSGGTFTVTGSGFTSDAKVSVKLPGALFLTTLPTKFIGPAQLQATMPAFSGRPTVLVKQTSGQVKLLNAVAATN